MLIPRMLFPLCRYTYSVRWEKGGSVVGKGEMVFTLFFRKLGRWMLLSELSGTKAFLERLAGFVKAKIETLENYLKFDIFLVCQMLSFESKLHCTTVVPTPAEIFVNKHRIFISS